MPATSRCYLELIFNMAVLGCGTSNTNGIRKMWNIMICGCLGSSVCWNDLRMCSCLLKSVRTLLCTNIFILKLCHLSYVWVLLSVVHLTKCAILWISVAYSVFIWMLLFLIVLLFFLVLFCLFIKGKKCKEFQYPKKRIALMHPHRMCFEAQVTLAWTVKHEMLQGNFQCW